MLFHIFHLLVWPMYVCTYVCMYVRMYALGRVVQRMQYTMPDLKFFKSEVVWYHSLIVSLHDIVFNTRCPHLLCV